MTIKANKVITPVVFLLSLVSLLNDISSEMLIPVLPAYLSSIGYSALFIGILEGLAELISGYSKAYFGKLSDHFEQRMPFVRLGYAMSAIGKSMMVLWANTIWVLGSRSLDRLGKGVRTGARDAVLADASVGSDRGKVFGFNKMMDTTGAAIGVGLAALFLFYSPGNYRLLFLAAFLPALAAVGVTFLVKEPMKASDSKTKSVPSIWNSFAYWKIAGPTYKYLLIGFLLFALFNSSDAFIFLIGKQIGLSDTVVLLSYLGFNCVYAALAYPLGHLADKVGMRLTYLIGVVFFALAYALFGQSSGLLSYAIAFLVYSVFTAATDGIAKAWLSKSIKSNHKAEAMGFFAGMQSIVILMANILAGLVWTHFSAKALFLFSAGGALLVLVYFLLAPKEQTNTSA